MVMDRPFEVIAHVKRRETKMSSGDPLTLELRGGDKKEGVTKLWPSNNSGIRMEHWKS